MAVTLTELAAALRLGDGIHAPAEPVHVILTRLMAVGAALVDEAAPAAPTAIRDEAIVLLAGYLYDQPSAPSGDRYSAAWRNSGAESLTTHFVERRAVGAAAEPLPALALLWTA